MDFSSFLKVDLQKQGKPMQICKLLGLGNGGFGINGEPCWESKMPLIKPLAPSLIRLFVMDNLEIYGGPGVYNWETIDRCVKAITDTGAQPLMCLLLKPADFFPSLDAHIVEPNDWEAYGEFIKQIVIRYAAVARFWEVGNEPECGEAGGGTFFFTPEGYAGYYARMSRLIREACPEAKVGGAALSICGADYPRENAVQHTMLKHIQTENLPFDFISWHAYSNDPNDIERVVVEMKQLLLDYGFDVETIIDEWNSGLHFPHANPAFQPCHIAEVVRRMKNAGLDWSCYYEIQDPVMCPDKLRKLLSPNGTAAVVRQFNRLPMHLGLFDQLGEMRPAYFAFTLLSWLAGNRVEVLEDTPVHALATYDPELFAYSLIVWNYSDDNADARITLNGVEGGMSAHGYRLDAHTDSNELLRRLRPQPVERLEQNAKELAVNLNPYEIAYWTLISDEQASMVG